MSAVLAMETPALTLADINRLDCVRFVAALGGVFEHSPWVATGAWAERPFVNIDHLHRAMMDVVRATSREVRIDFLRMHPELAGKEAQAGTMTGHSTTEQAGLNALSRDQLQTLRSLNAAYAAKHGFPFVIAVLANTRAQIFEALRTRTARDTDIELEAALDQIAIITRLRLGRLLASPVM
ncbi:2-oxo-4-hydroxy-4-carboxy-5-ureidoimidazoline decarboxylase [Variovorax sp. J2P1-59]|uniref:2-oxo-4-hydroxy-4-carboxy-5-ureidoimidazoline decarboxylase n=1 Tax=Variovorax flavidus TaxID=3053501 RepID=UPI002576EA31|nr:2-oxo-4-hydroxy-4-carboxy-5-ureidoimidazoline decarboxylase [Variovorax sp. J2P1-59]MDM0076233.1 2-oxo-4-hydroxy-4-carboxy-5-ureidoimidazoline decarboxylase [Variovorax sp. J2P1-59]